MKIKGIPWLVGVLAMAIVIISGGSRAFAKIQDPNLGPYIYEQHEVLTNAQYQQIMRLNQKMKQGKRRQFLSLYIADRIPSNESVDGDNLSGTPNGAGYANSIGDTWNDRQTRKWDSESYDYDINYMKRFRLGNQRNVMVVGLKDHRIAVSGSGVTDEYFSDMKFDLLKWDLKDKLKSNDTDTQISAAVQVFSRVSNRIISQKAMNHDSLSWADFRGDIIGGIVFVIFGGFLLLIIIHLWHNRGKGGGGASYADGEFDEGYVLGMMQGEQQDNDRY